MENLIPIVHNSMPHGDGVLPLQDSEKLCLVEIREILKKHGKLERFGITLLHKHFDLSDDEILIESIDEERKMQIIKPMKKEEVANLEGEILETCWSLQEGDVLMGCRRTCVRQDGKHYPNVHVFT